MFRNRSLRFRMMAAVFGVVFLISVLGFITFSGISEILGSGNSVQKSLQGVNSSSRILLEMLEQYQQIAELYINREYQAIEVFQKLSEKSDQSLKQLEQNLPEKKQEFAKIALLKQKFNETFQGKIVPEIRYLDQNLLHLYADEAEKPLRSAIESIGRIIESVKSDLKQCTPEEISEESEHLVLFSDMKTVFFDLYALMVKTVLYTDEKQISLFEAGIAKLDGMLGKADNAAEGSEKNLVSEMKNSQEKLKDLFDKKILPEVRRTMEKRFHSYDLESDSSLEEIQKLLSEISEAQTKLADQSVKNAEISGQHTLNRVFWVSVTAAVIAIFFGWMLASSLTVTVGKISSALKTAAGQLKNATEQIADSSQNLAAGTSEQSSSLEETSSALEEISAIIKNTSENARLTDTMSEEARNEAERSKVSMEKMSETISRIKNSSDQTAKILKTIDEIAFQTNLLALNAAVEAARAGEAGKGFAVVAEEVRSLAQRSAEAARSTAELIEESRKNAAAGVSVTGEISEVLDSILEKVRKVSSLVSEVSAATAEQTQGIEQISSAILQMNNVVQSTAAGSEEIASSGEEISAQAHDLDQMVTGLAEAVFGKKHGEKKEMKSSDITDKILVHKNKAESGNKTQARKNIAVSKLSPKAKVKTDPEKIIPLSDDDFSEF